MPCIVDENCAESLNFCPFVQNTRAGWISVSALNHALTMIRSYQMAEKPPSTANSTPFT